MKREIPVKNYVILILVFLVTIVAVFYVRDWYNTTKNYYAQNSVMTKVVREIKSEEISTDSAVDESMQDSVLSVLRQNFLEV